MLIYSEGHAAIVLGEYVARYNAHRPHQSRQQRAPNDERLLLAPTPDGPILRRRVLDGLINEYQRAG